MTDLVHSGSASIPGGYEADGATMLERAARAAALADGVLPECDSWVDYFPIARAVLMSVRELSSEIRDEHLYDNEYGYAMYYEGWQPAIDAILADGEGR